MDNELHKVILDTDIGDDIDDSLALLLLLNSKDKFNLLGVTTVFRNSYKRAKMAKQLISAMESDVEVYAGEDFPFKTDPDHLDREKILAKEKVDETGKYLFPQWSESMREFPVNEQGAVDFIIEQVHKYPYEVTIICIGPLTNIARAIKKDPSIVPLLKGLRIMGGGYELDRPEWNVYCDPEATSIVYSSGIADIHAIGCDITSRTWLSQNDIDLLKNSTAKPIHLVYHAMKKWFTYYEYVRPVMHDPLTVVSLIDPTVVTFKEMHMDVNLEDKRGYTFVNPNCQNIVNVAVDVNKEKFFKIFKGTLGLEEA